MYKYPITAREFVFKYWFNNDGKPSSAVTKILGYIANDKLTLKGRQAYRTLMKNTTNK